MRRAMQEYDSRLVHSAETCNGHAVFKGTRVPLQVVLDSLAEGSSTEDILEDFPSLSAADVQAAIAFAVRKMEGA
jgi:uncharacterized protein (DUF433 family)